MSTTTATTRRHAGALAAAALLAAGAATLATPAPAEAQSATDWHAVGATCTGGQEVTIHAMGIGYQVEFRWHHNSPRAPWFSASEDLGDGVFANRGIRTGLETASGLVRVVGTNGNDLGPNIQGPAALCKDPL